MKDVLEKYPITPYDLNMFNKGRVDLIKQAIRDFPELHRVTSGDLNNEHANYILLNCINQAPGTVHMGMFMRCIEIMGTDEQKKQYLEKCRTFEIVGCYAQT